VAGAFRGAETESHSIKEITMLVVTIVQRAITGTPLWVWGLLAALVALGLSQVRTRTVGEVRLAALPLAMAAYSLLGLAPAFQLTAASAVAWLAGVSATLAAGRALGRPSAVRYLPDARRFVVPGSWIPLAIILAIFLSRYVVAVSLAMHPDLRQAVPFAIGTSLAYGLLGGIFPARALRIWTQRIPS
jgi:Family of unknown function (DUF6622)